jgi:hypothetical protein
VKAVSGGPSSPGTCAPRSPPDLHRRAAPRPDVIIIPFVFLVVRPAGTEAQLQYAQHWLRSRARQVLAAVVLVVGAYMVISGLALS